MSDIQERGASRSAAAAGPIVVLTHYDEAAALFSAKLSELIGLIPAFEPRHAETEQFVRRYQSFSNDAIRSVIAAIELNPDLNSANKYDVQGGRGTLQFLDSFRTSLDQIDELRTNFRFTYFAKKARGIADALVMYQIAKGMGRDPSSAGIAAHARVIKRDLRRPRVKKAKPTDPPQPKDPQQK